MKNYMDISVSDFISKISFESEDGKIWFDGDRSLLFNANSLYTLKHFLIDEYGIDLAKKVIYRWGYEIGSEDAVRALKLRADDQLSAFVAGPQLAKIRGMVNVDIETLDFNPKQNKFKGIFKWNDSYEAYAQIKNRSYSTHCCCWWLTGYSSGYTSKFLNAPFHYVETHCVAKGDECCRIESHEGQDRHFGLKSEYFIETIKPLFSNSYFDAIGKSKTFAKVCQLLLKAAESDITVLLQGSTGVGKEAFARGIHQNSARKDKEFVAINCACLPEQLIEAELFGSNKGAFTGATENRFGKFERADGGTIFLDEIIELSPKAQASLLRVLQTGEFERVGDTKTRKTNVRVVVACNESLKKAVDEGRFRSDLYYRLATYPVLIPSLKERREDINLLLEYYIRFFEKQYEKTFNGFSDRVYAFFNSYEWPGNIRELRNIVERAVLLSNDVPLDLEDLMLEDNVIQSFVSQHKQKVNGIKGIATHSDLDQFIENLMHNSEQLDIEYVEATILQTALQKYRGNVSKAARYLNMTRSALEYRLKKHAVI